MRRYWIDASAIIWANREFLPVETMPKYWAWLATKFADGSVVTHKFVYKEIISGANGEKPNPIAVWTKSRQGAWCSYGCTDESKVLVGKISAYCIAKYGYPVAKEFLRGADPFLIARAALDDGVVVTQESVLKEPRIPKICREFGVEYTTINKMNLILKMKF